MRKGSFMKSFKFALKTGLLIYLFYLPFAGPSFCVAMSEEEGWQMMPDILVRTGYNPTSKSTISPHPFKTHFTVFDHNTRDIPLFNVVYCSLLCHTART